MVMVMVVMMSMVNDDVLSDCVFLKLWLGQETPHILDKKRRFPWYHHHNHQPHQSSHNHSLVVVSAPMIGLGISSGQIPSNLVVYPTGTHHFFFIIIPCFLEAVVWCDHGTNMFWFTFSWYWLCWWRVLNERGRWAICVQRHHDNNHNHQPFVSFWAGYVDGHDL